MLFYKFLKLSSFLKISFSILFEWLLLPCRPGHLPVLLFHLVCCSTSVVYFQFSYCILQLYDFCLVPYYVLFLFVEVLSVFFILLLSLVSILMTITLNSLSGAENITSLYFIKLFFFLKFYLVPSFRTFSSISSFCLTLFLLVCKTAISSVLKDSLCLDMALLSFWGKQEFSYFSSSSQSKLFYM